MSQTPVFDPREARCKSPFGAAACGTTVRFSTFPDAEESFCRCVLVVLHEFANVWREFPLTADGDGFTVDFKAPDTAELLWYHFRFEREDGSSVCYGRRGFESWNTVLSWQLTVYEPMAAPEWFEGGMIYQIFPDRFCRSETPKPSSFPAERFVHETWDEPMLRSELFPDRPYNSDFFGGNFAGIISKLDYLQSLGVRTIYMNPIFLAASTHRYDTADYERIDPMLGTEEDFKKLCDAAHKRGMRVILDGVFNHTGSNSRYFNAEGAFDDVGAAQSKDSPYYKWYRFMDWPRVYESWWGITTLPSVEESEESYVSYIVDGKDSIIRRWLRLGADGWRLDVADELPDWFIERIRRAMDEEKPGSLLLGEVWEDGSNKVAYSERRRYLLGRETNCLMNYPFRNAVLSYLGGGDAADFMGAMETIRENYPDHAFHAAMNFLSTHDTPRILTLLGAKYAPDSREGRAMFRLNEEQHTLGVKLLRLASLLLFTFPGVPAVFYGDEAGMQGWEDPFNRGTYPWGREDEDLLAHFRRLGQLRASLKPLHHGAIEYHCAKGGVLSFSRIRDGKRACVVINARSEWAEQTLSWNAPFACDALSAACFPAADGELRLHLPPYSGFLFVEE